MTTRMSSAQLEKRFFEVLFKVSRGEKFSITRNRKVVARILPSRNLRWEPDMIEALEELAAAERKKL